MKERIDAMTYEELLRHWRYAPSGDPLFKGETGKYYHQVMEQKRKPLTDKERLAVSKKIGFH